MLYVDTAVVDIIHNTTSILIFVYRTTTIANTTTTHTTIVQVQMQREHKQFPSYGMKRTIKLIKRCIATKGGYSILTSFIV